MFTNVLAAVIALAGSVIVAIVGFRSAIRNTDRMLKADREKRLWERRSAIYVDIIAYATHEHEVLSNQLRTLSLAREQEAAIKAELDSYVPSSFPEFEARIRAYATDAVLGACQSLFDAENAVINAQRDRDAIRLKRSLPGHRLDLREGIEDEMTLTNQKIENAFKAEKRAVDFVIETIRSELSP